MAEPPPVDFDPSKLGTKEHWDEVYQREKGAFEEIADEGEVWFGEDVLDKMVDWALANVPPSSKPFVLDVGTGNGVSLFALAEAGYDTARLAGVDYSAPSVDLAKSIADSREFPDITFQQCDVLKDLPDALPGMSGSDGWDLLLDKGTFDAISLSEHGTSGDRPSHAYPLRIARLLRRGGLLLITSCNFTEEEITSLFATSDTGLRFHSRVKHRSFSFGGKTGSVVCTVAFEKVTE